MISEHVEMSTGFQNKSKLVNYNKKAAAYIKSHRHRTRLRNLKQKYSSFYLLYLI